MGTSLFRALAQRGGDIDPLTGQTRVDPMSGFTPMQPVSTIGQGIAQGGSALINAFMTKNRMKEQDGARKTAAEKLALALMPPQIDASSAQMSSTGTMGDVMEGAQADGTKAPRQALVEALLANPEMAGAAKRYAGYQGLPESVRTSPIAKAAFGIESPDAFETVTGEEAVALGFTPDTVLQRSKTTGQVSVLRKPEAAKAPETRNIIRGGQQVTQEWTGSGWKDVGAGPRWQPESGGSTFETIPSEEAAAMGFPAGSLLQRNTKTGAISVVREPKETKGPTPPAGYRWNEDGTLSAIPGGPASQKQAPAGYQFNGDGTLSVIPGGPADKPPKPDVPFDSKALDAEMMNELIKGDPGTPQYAAAYGRLAQPRTQFDPASGQMSTINPDMSMFRKPTYTVGGAAPMPASTGQRQGTTADGRPVVGNVDGSVSTERSITIQKPDGTWTNIPTMYGGREVPDEEAYATAERNGWKDPETGRQFGTWPTVEAAETAARARSNEIGAGLPAPSPPQAGPSAGVSVQQVAPPAPKPMTGEQSNAALFADRMTQANEIIKKVGQVGTSVLERSKASLPGVGNYLVSPEYQQFDQAKRDFINAVLRRESGAVIADSEFANAEKQYFPQPGDKPETIAQKAANRRTAIDAIGRAAGPTYAAPPTPAVPAQPLPSGLPPLPPGFVVSP